MDQRRLRKAMVCVVLYPKTAYATQVSHEMTLA